MYFFVKYLPLSGAYAQTKAAPNWVPPIMNQTDGPVGLN